MSVRILVETESAKRDRLIAESIDRAMLGINQAIARLSDDKDRKMVYARLIDRLNGRVSAKIRRKTVTAYHKGARREFLNRREASK